MSVSRTPTFRWPVLELGASRRICMTRVDVGVVLVGPVRLQSMGYRVTQRQPGRAGPRVRVELTDIGGHKDLIRRHGLIEQEHSVPATSLAVDSVDVQDEAGEVLDEDARLDACLGSRQGHPQGQTAERPVRRGHDQRGEGQIDEEERESRRDEGPGPTRLSGTPQDCSATNSESADRRPAVIRTANRAPIGMVSTRT